MTTSIYDRVLASPVARAAYFNMTRGLLRSAIESEGLQEALEGLQQVSFPFVFAEEQGLPWPVMLIDGVEVEGADAIVAAARMALATSE